MPSKVVGVRMSAEQKLALEVTAKHNGKNVTDYIWSRLPRSVSHPLKRKRRK